MCTELQIAILGVVGTLLGTVVGWMLNNLSRAGRLHIYFSNWADSFLQNDGDRIPSFRKEDTEYYEYSFEMDLYNSSSDPNVMRNVSVVFLDEKGIAKKCTPRDDDTKRRINQQFVQNSFERFDLEPINVPPKTVRKCRLINNFSARNDGLDFIWNTVKIELEYTNKNNKTKRILIRQHDYSETFLETHRRTN